MQTPEPLTNEEVIARLDVILRKISELSTTIEELIADGKSE